MAENVATKVREIIAEQAMVEPCEVALDATLESLGVDSLGLVETVFAIEEAFDVHVPFNANDPESKSFDISSVASIVKAVEALIAEAK
ncbi:MAG: acyl carrier protein [Rhodobacteraceae bacterium]|nr:acyl carrier protein [Paracoccaceae bacterium]